MIVFIFSKMNRIKYLVVSIRNYTDFFYSPLPPKSGCSNQNVFRADRNKRDLLVPSSSTESSKLWRKFIEYSLFRLSETLDSRRRFVCLEAASLNYACRLPSRDEWNNKGLSFLLLCLSSSSPYHRANVT